MKILIDEAPAGPAMDAAVAQALGLKVLGIAPCLRAPECFGFHIPFKRKGDTLRPVHLVRCACEFREPDDRDYFGHIASCLEVVQDYSARIAAAWELLESAKLFLFRVDQEASPRFPAYHIWFAGKWPQKEYMSFFAGATYDTRLELCLDGTAKGSYAETATLAICRAFLKANGVEYIEVLE